MQNQPQDPYAPPPRHRDRSGGVVRFVIIAALLGAAVWGYMTYANTNDGGLIAAEEQQLAENEAQPQYRSSEFEEPAEFEDPAETEPEADQPQ